MNNFIYSCKLASIRCVLKILFLINLQIATKYIKYT